MRSVQVGNLVTLHCGDNAQQLAALPASYALVSDPPYGIAYKHSGGGRGLVGHRDTRAVPGDDQPFDPAPLMRFDDVVIWGANHYAKRLPDGGAWHCWDKRGGNSRGPDDSFADVEFAWTKARTKSRVFNYLWKGICKDGENGIRRLHPTQKPIALMEWCIERFTAPGATIFDPYMGSATTAIAAMRLGRPFVGIEISTEFFDAAVDRVTAAHDRLTRSTA